ncbi:SGNH/GDSL hydrolase family protein [Vreelandella populi]|uniref:SGNH/GDSL hydrolase family protein n=1 Tax=Vreelandella populi TaxID=2498858 RepID=UPI001C8DCBA6|nr:SGNH/GDSL hydrolase family protein [Halomonas populi]
MTGIRQMKTILAFGDSLTWGTDAQTDGRHTFDYRWPNVLQKVLGPNWDVVAEGLGGRTTIYDDLSSPIDRNGANVLPILLSSHFPLDLVIIMLGLNDLKREIAGSADAAAIGMMRLIEIIKHHPYRWSNAVPQIMIVSPPHLRNRVDGKPPMGNRSIEESKRLSLLYRQIASQYEISFFDAATVAEADPIDGVHLTANATHAIGLALAQQVEIELGIIS